MIYRIHEFCPSHSYNVLTKYSIIILHYIIINYINCLMYTEIFEVNDISQMHSGQVIKELIYINNIIIYILSAP